MSSGLSWEAVATQVKQTLQDPAARAESLRQTGQYTIEQAALKWLCAGRGDGRQEMRWLHEVRRTANERVEAALRIRPDLDLFDIRVKLADMIAGQIEAEEAELAKAAKRSRQAELVASRQAPTSG